METDKQHVLDVVRIIYSITWAARKLHVVVAAAVAVMVADVVSYAVASAAVQRMQHAAVLVEHSVAVVVVAAAVVSNIVVGSLIVVPSLLAQFSMPTDVNVVLASLLQFAVVPVRSWRLD